MERAIRDFTSGNGYTAQRFRQIISAANRTVCGVIIVRLHHSVRIRVGGFTEDIAKGILIGVSCRLCTAAYEG